MWFDSRLWLASGTGTDVCPWSGLQVWAAWGHAGPSSPSLDGAHTRKDGIPRKTSPPPPPSVQPPPFCLAHAQPTCHASRHVHQITLSLRRAVIHTPGQSQVPAVVAVVSIKDMLVLVMGRGVGVLELDASILILPSRRGLVQRVAGLAEASNGGVAARRVLGQGLVRLLLLLALNGGVLWCAN